MNEMPAQSYPAPQKSNNGYLWAALIFVTLVLCIFCSIGGLIGFYYSAEIISGVRELVDINIVDPIEVVAEGNTSSSPADEDETDTDTAPSDNNKDGWQIDYDAFERLPDGYCAFAGGVTEPWNGVPNVNYVGLLRQDAQTDGFSWQAYTQHTTNLEEVEGNNIPNNVEWINDGGDQVQVCKDNGELYVIMPDRKGNQDVQFYQVSYTKLDGHDLLVCSDDDGVPGDFNGGCDGDQSIVHGISIYDFEVPADLQFHFDMMADMLYSTKSNHHSGMLVEVIYAWIK